MFIKEPLYRLVDHDSGFHYYCENPYCGGNLFHFHSGAVLVCNACETVPMSAFIKNFDAIETGGETLVSQ